jgi:T-complex protein 1 subunit beta
MAIEHADFEGVERLAQVLGGEIVSTFDTPDKVRLGTCNLIEEVIIGEDKLIKFSGLLLSLIERFIEYFVKSRCSTR